ncbi:MAG: hypothetical protein AAGD03_04915 [Bordetella sp.]|nr:hypothetical protein [Pseudomonadota bacterium]
MKLDRAGAPHQQPLAPEEWTMTMLRDGSQHIAVVERRGVPMCRVSTVAGDKTSEQLQTDLAEKARAWIAEFLGREGGQR